MKAVYMVAEDYGYNNYSEDSLTVFDTYEGAEIFMAQLISDGKHAEDVSIWMRPVKSIDEPVK